MTSSIRHQIPITQALLIVIVVLLLVDDVVADFVELGTDLGIGIATIHLASKDMSTLCGSPWLSVCHDVSVWSSLLNLSDHLQLIRVVDDELSWLSFIICRS